ncbi:cap-specific mRNA (nucleoside-2'-O-)-methyltransferase 2 [Synchiropus splendidus]|uniref:cap-specific mRNA (nucleoside-2'-O-)-methyltransferase 2 n=1 Tax=Synchiropus splendidus TaxID=270530 RepID=UPI00237D6A4A|nr:cap-specific mRNA (nucleoside-2'-O-)-methyltransferase 2 [Synchiropus splendidus]
MSSGHDSRKRGGRTQHNNMVVYDHETLTEIKGLFCKVRSYAKPAAGEWRLPHPNDVLSHPVKKACQLPGLKQSLNSVKNQLSDKNVQVWHQHTNFTNRAGKVIGAVRSAGNAEICTQAWCKFYEIVGSFPLLPEEALLSGELNTVHLCEAPGAFIAALNHYIKTSAATRFCDWSWAANTLNPYHEANAGGTAIADDRLIANTLPWWFFGSDDTGDIMLQKHLLELRAFVSNMRRVDLVTADGSFDCQENPGEQEALVASLHYCEVTAALLLLSPGGSFVLKMFTLYEHSSVCLLYLLNCCFRSVNVFKPATSKPGNSEVYVVCLDYDGKEAASPLLSKLIRNYGAQMAHREALFPDALLPQSFLSQHEDVCSYFHRLQVETITENLRLFKDMSLEKRQQLDYIREAAAHEYLHRFQVSHLPRSRWVSRNTVNPACCRLSSGRPLGQKKQTGSFNERRELQSLSWRERVQKSCYASQIKTHCSQSREAVCLLEGPAAARSTESWFVIVGRTLPAVTNSSFCDCALLNHLNEAVTDAVAAMSDWGQRPSCVSCQALSAASILADVRELDVSTERKVKRRCLVFGSGWDSCPSQVEDLVLTFAAAPSFPQKGLIKLHDSEAQYQHQLLGCLVFSLRSLSPGDALLLPVLSALTRVTAAVVLCLHVCFHSVTFRCPPPAGAVGALLLCGGFNPEAAVRILPFLTEVHNRMGQLLTAEEGASEKQVLQFVPMEELLTGGLTEFLLTMNSEIIQHKLHLLMQT